jgi:hypothetical protein
MIPLSQQIHTATSFILILKHRVATFHLFIEGLKSFGISQIFAFQIVLMGRRPPAGRRRRRARQ